MPLSLETNAISNLYRKAKLEPAKDATAKRAYSMLDCFCGLGGASEGFAREGFDVTGIDIVNVGYPYHFILAGMQSLKGEDFRDYDVIWGSPPCRDFTILNDGTWKVKKNPKRGLELVNCYLSFIEKAQPRIWIMENVWGLEKYLSKKATVHRAFLTPYMRRSFWGDFPQFLFPIAKGGKHGETSGFPKLASWQRAKIPLPCSLAFARACKEALLSEKTLEVKP